MSTDCTGTLAKRFPIVTSVPAGATCTVPATVSVTRLTVAGTLDVTGGTVGTVTMVAGGATSLTDGHVSNVSGVTGSTFTQTGGQLVNLVDGGAVTMSGGASSVDITLQPGATAAISGRHNELRSSQAAALQIGAAGTVTNLVDVTIAGMTGGPLSVCNTDVDEFSLTGTAAAVGTAVLGDKAAGCTAPDSFTELTVNGNAAAVDVAGNRIDGLQVNNNTPGGASVVGNRISNFRSCSGNSPFTDDDNDVSGFHCVPQAPTPTPTPSGSR